MPYAAALSVEPETSKALEQACEQAGSSLGGKTDLAVVFFSSHHIPQAAEIGTYLQKTLEPGCLVGCQGEAIVGNEREVEDRPALVVWLARWSKPASQTAFHISFEDTSEGPSFLGLPDQLDTADPAKSVLFLLADPFTFPVDEFFQRLHESSPGLRVVGGMSSGIRAPGDAALILGAGLHRSGGVGLLLEGGTTVRSVVCQGCRPVGTHMVVTKAKDNLIMELGGEPALVRLQQLWQTLSPADQELVRQGLHIGRVVSEFGGEFQRGDFLVRNAVGFDRGSGAIAITERVRVGQTIQFHVRDAATADQDLHEMLQIDQNAHEFPPAAALLFTCNGRGTRLFGAPDHDARVLREEVGTIPVAGFFAQGEIGPVSGQNFIHGFTASVVLFED